jgi:CRP-like cAMP-binding protein
MEQGPSLNHILASLPPEELNCRAGDFELVTLQANQSLFRYGETIDYIFFPLTTVASLLCLLESGQNIEIGLVGREGLIGLPSVIGSTRAIYSAEVLIPGQAIRVRTETMRTCFALHEGGCQQLMHYSLSLLTQFSQLAACNLCHHIPERVCRWLLLLQDRSAQDEFQLTHEQIAIRLGIRRSGITTQLGQLEEKGAIEAHRGRIKIVDRRKLEAVSCECYRCLAEEFKLTAAPSSVAIASVGSANKWRQPIDRVGSSRALYYSRP